MESCAVLIRMADIPDDGLALTGATPVELETGASADALRGIGPVEYRLSVVRAGERRLIRGSLSATVEASCGRCARRYTIDVQRDFEALYQQTSAVQLRRRRELDADDLSLDYYEGDTLDGARFLAEQVLLALPMKLLCDESCKGLCLKCGANLNVEECDCRADVDPRMSSLAAIRDQL